MTVAAPPRHSADSAIAAAADLAARFAEDSALRDRERILPVAEVEALSASGLLAITVPTEYGGPGLGAAVLTEVVRLVATGDPNVAQIPHSHFVYVNALVEQGTEEQKRFLLGEVVAGRRFGNAQSEIGSKHVRDHATTLRPDPAAPGAWVLDGEKGYATGALLAHWIPVLAHLGEGGPLSVAWVERDAPGVTVVDDWDGLGQRTTASGTVRLERVRVAADRVTPYHLTFERPQAYGSFAQLLHAAIDAGIARAAVRDAAAFVTTRSRPYPDALALYDTSGAAGDPLVVQAFGEVELQVRAAEALLAEAGRAVDRARASLTAATAAEASLAVAAARASTTAASLEASSRLFEVAGTRSALRSHDLDRHWRNARTHTLHDPAAWKVHHLGRHAIDGTPPPNHGQI
ncbi:MULTISPECIES: SfnB family sulfur acquisition oxidoreductase [unclassified Nocardioides]|uniref:SfnB family sulfur acquisition oxidoreductase n=1 Tax=unclassified Nocardioides TaxID=2615069 RepID=UPI0007035AA2|nr:MULTISPECIES: SfnB family sulfur acquisition oxidoreductase [unclassified Nocardioides]KRC51444.1 SfnB family sulfur acquisition oxidoreductase [Nocardioides sp. Root79]KRC69053.1 SfnB family sulfur acquisition oxidoreductase [Nocardioides sp. Root240]